MTVKARPLKPKACARPAVDSVERTLSQVGDAWSFLVLREAYFGIRRFDAFVRGLKAPASIVADRLKKLVAFNLLERRLYCERPPRHEYVLTQKGLDLYPAIVLLMRWGDRWLDEGKGPPLVLTHRLCGDVSHPVLVCDICGAPVHARDMEWKCAGPEVVD